MGNIILSIAECTAKMRVDYTDVDSTFTQGVSDGDTLSMKATDGNTSQVYSVSTILNNIGIDDLIITSIIDVDDPSSLFTVTPIIALPWTIASTSSQGYTLEFTGTPTPGTYNCVVQIVHNGSNESTPFELEYTITIS